MKKKGGKKGVRREKEAGCSGERRPAILIRLLKPSTVTKRDYNSRG